MSRTSLHFRSILGIFALVAAGFVAVPSANAVVATDHCLNHTTEVKVGAEYSPATVQVVDTRTGDLVTVVVTISGPNVTIAAVDPAVDLVDASWCIKSSTKTNSGTGLTGVSTSVNKKGMVQAVSYVVIYSVTSEDDVIIQPCNAATTSGGAGVTTTDHELGTSGATSFLFEWEAYSVPDQFQVYYEGALVYDTGVVGDNLNEGTGSATVTLPSGSSTKVTVVVTGPTGTIWDYIVNCPTTTSS